MPSTGKADPSPAPGQPLSQVVKSPIHFGTAGWRGLIARDFTFENVRLAAQGLALHLKGELRRKTSPLHGRKPLIIIGHDTRFLGREFALATAEILTQNGLEPLLCNRDAPTPVLAFSIRRLKTIGGVNITASHNPFGYSGFKYSMPNGAGAPREVTGKIEAHVEKLLAKKWRPKSTVVGTFQCRTFDPRPAYLKRIRQLVDLPAIGRAKLKIAVELMHGTGRGYLDTLLEEAGAQVIRLRDTLNPLFGGGSPEPSPEGMREASDLVRAGKAQLGLGLDGDADRFGIVDRNGTWLTPNQVLALALYHLRKNRGIRGAVVRTVPTSHQVDAVAELLGVKVYETPVGFKHIGALMESEPIIVGGEESGGLSIRGHIPEKDGVLACLLMAELVAMEGKPLGRILRDLEKQTGEFHTERINIAVPPDEKAAILKKLGGGFDKIGRFAVQQFITTDGFKFLLPDNEWVAFRASGTEPVIRCYLEAKSAQHLKQLKSVCRKILTGK